MDGLGIICGGRKDEMRIAEGVTDGDRESEGRTPISTVIGGFSNGDIGILSAGRGDR